MTVRKSKGVLTTRNRSCQVKPGNSIPSARRTSLRAPSAPMSQRPDRRSVLPLRAIATSTPVPELAELAKPFFVAKDLDKIPEERFEKAIAPDEVKAVLAGEIERVLSHVAKPLEVTTRPFVILVAGVNGSGKTTTIGKLAARFRAEGMSVMLVAGDTFRAAAIGMK